jgi:hypothetical protein
VGILPEPFFNKKPKHVFFSGDSFGMVTCPFVHPYVMNKTQAEYIHFTNVTHHKHGMIFMNNTPT